jgi:TrmH family RNA methyltransferase
LYKITSPANPAIKTLKSLHSKKGRGETGLFLAEGARLVWEASQSGIWPRFLLVSSCATERESLATLVAAALEKGVRCIETTPAILESVSRRENAQSVVAAYPHLPTALHRLQPGANRLWIALDGVRDPGNLGTIWRTADAVGAGGLILIGRTCDPFSVEAVRATMGSLFAVALARAEFGELDAWRKAGGLRLVGASLKGGPIAEEPAGATLILMGNEQSGLASDIERACDDLVRLPMSGRADSLNLAAASAVMLYDVWRRQGYEGAR